MEDEEILKFLKNKIFIRSIDIYQNLYFNKVIENLSNNCSDDIHIICRRDTVNCKTLTITVYKDNKVDYQFQTYIFSNKDEYKFFISNYFDDSIKYVIRKEVRRLKIDNL